MKKINRQIILEFLLATAIFYALLALNVFHIGDYISPPEKDYIDATTQAEIIINNTGDQYIEDAMQEMQNTHGAAEETDTSQTKFESVCSSNETLCDAVHFEGIYTEKEKYLYLSSIFKVANFINDYIVTQQQTENTLEKVAISKDNGQRRGYATRDTIILNLGSVKSNNEFLQLVNHELGHILDLGMLQGEGDTYSKTYTEFGNEVFALDDISLKFYALSRDNETIRKSTASKKDFCSGYGMSDPFEDLAECFNLYTNNNKLFQSFALGNATMKKKFNFMAKLFDGKYISKGSSTMSAGTRPRDTTKIN